MRSYAGHNALTCLSLVHHLLLSKEITSRVTEFTKTVSRMLIYVLLYILMMYEMDFKNVFCIILASELLVHVSRANSLA